MPSLEEQLEGQIGVDQLVAAIVTRPPMKRYDPQGRVAFKLWVRIPELGSVGSLWALCYVPGKWAADVLPLVPGDTVRLLGRITVATWKDETGRGRKRAQLHVRSLERLGVPTANSEATR